MKSHIVEFNKKFVQKLCAFPHNSLVAFKLFVIHSTAFLLKRKALY